MHIKLNGQLHELQGDMAPLFAILEVLGYDTAQTGIAVAVNAAVVPRSQWKIHQIEPGDEIEVITARQGG
jgi:sulfur carrier protein